MVEMVSQRVDLPPIIFFFFFFFFPTWYVILPQGKGKPCIVVDGSSQKGFKKWRKATVHPTNLSKKMTAQELLVS